MSLIGFATLTFLKAQLLAEALRTDPAYDGIVTQVGKGVAGQFENFCNRKFARVEGFVETTAADYCSFQMARFPLEVMTSIELKMNETDGFVMQTLPGYVRSFDLAKGVVYLPENADAGPYYAQLRFTYTGGYWIDGTDECSATAPAGQTALPDELRFAWIIQCKRVWESIDKTGVDILHVGPGEKGGRFELGTGGLELAPQVQQTLRNFVREQWV